MRGTGRHDPRGRQKDTGAELNPQPSPRPLGLSLQPHGHAPLQRAGPSPSFWGGGTVQDGIRKTDDIPREAPIHNLKGAPEMSRAGWRCPHSPHVPVRTAPPTPPASAPEAATHGTWHRVPAGSRRRARGTAAALCRALAAAATSRPPPPARRGRPTSAGALGLDRPPHCCRGKRCEKRGPGFSDNHGDASPGLSSRETPQRPRHACHQLGSVQHPREGDTPPAPPVTTELAAAGPGRSPLTGADRGRT